LHVRTYGNDIACSFMTSNAACRLGHDRTRGSPFIVQKRFVRGAETGPIDLDEDLSWFVRITLAMKNKSETNLGQALEELQFF
jgi:hypothetical protein